MIVSRLLCTNAVGSHGSGGTLPCNGGAAAGDPLASYATGPAAVKARGIQGYARWFPLAVVEHELPGSCGW
jgi:hypothetical protein